MIRLFRVRGIPIRLDAGWLIVYGLITWSLASGYFPSVVPDRSTGAYWTSGLLAATLLFASVLVHELAHALVARVFRVGVAGITLHVFGGVAELESEPPHPRAELIIAIVGPVTSLAVGAAVLGLRQVAGGEPWVAALLGYLGVVNLAVGLFNLAPGFPLDGGRILRALLWWWSDRYDWSTRIASFVGAGFALAVVALGLFRVFTGQAMGGVWFILLGAFLFEAARTSHRLARLKSGLDPVPAVTVMTQVPTMLPATATLESALVTAARSADRPAIPVVDGGRFVGFVRPPDLERQRGRSRTVGDVMIPAEAELIVAPHDSAWLALSRLSRNRAGTVAVVDDERVVGVIAREELARVIADASARRKLDRAA